MASSTELAQSTPLSAEGGMASDGAASRFMPYHSPHHQPAKGRYITSNDPRGYIPVYEYPLNGQWIMMDMDDGYILWTGIWKALGNHKADIVKMLESQPELATQLRRVRGGYLKIQGQSSVNVQANALPHDHHTYPGTWLAYEVALRLARRVGWPIRHDLVPLFGPTFPTTCLAPDQPGYGTVIPPTGRRKPRRSLQSVGIPPPHSVPYPPKLPLTKDLSYNAGRYIEGTGQGPMTPHLEAGHLRVSHGPLSTSPVNHHTVPFAPPAIPAVPALVPPNGVAYSAPELLGASQYTTSAATYSPMREYPSKARYSPYTPPRRHHPPPSTMSSYIVPSPFGYEQQHTRPLVHRASDPNLRPLHSRGHLLAPRLSLNTHQLPSARESKRPLPPLSSAPEGAEMAGDESQRFGMTEEFAGEAYGASSGDSARSSIPTPPFSEVGGPAYDPGWQVAPTPIDVGAQWPETPGDFSTTYEGSHYFTDSAASYSDPSSISPRTTWSYDGYGRHSPSERHYQYNPPRPMHHHYSSISSTTSFGERRMSMADSIASSFPEPDMPMPHMIYHRYSQPHLHSSIPPPHLEMWMRERSGSFAEASYSLQHAQQEHPNQEMVESQSMAPCQEYTSPQLAHSLEHRRSSSNGSMSGLGQLSHYSPNQESQVIAAW